MLIIGQKIIEFGSVSEDILPDTDGVRDLGGITKRFAEVRGQDGIFTYGGSITVSNTKKGNMVCAYAKNSGTVGNYKSGTGYGRGVIAGGYLDDSNFITATGDGSVAFGKTSTHGIPSYTGNISAIGQGSTALGFANGGQIYSRGEGSFVQGFAEDYGNIHTGVGSEGGFAQGYANGSSPIVSVIRSLNQGSFAQGYANQGGYITSSGTGSFAQGNAFTYTIKASGSGSFAQGKTDTANIYAEATNSVQFGPGTNDQPDTLQVGTQIRLKGTSGAIASINRHNGDIWVANNYVYIQSYGSPIKIVSAGS